MSLADLFFPKNSRRKWLPRLGRRPSQPRPRKVLEVDVDNDGSEDFTFNRSKFDQIIVELGEGNDLVRIDEANGIFTDTEKTTLDGEGGNDTLLGGSGAETLRGGDGNDTIDGNRGNDVALMGAGDDTFIWDPGDGSDTVEGQAGTDTLLFNGSNANENIDISANGSRVRFFRDIANVTMDLNDVEHVHFNALGGADTITVNDLTGTDVTQVTLDLAATPGGAPGDGQADRVIVNGTAGIDNITVAGNAAEVSVAGLAATVSITHAEFANDRLEISTLAAADTVNSAGLAPNVIQLFVDGVPV